MTHDELLAKIDNFEPDDELDSVKSMNSLCAVVELHKPEEYGGPARCRVDGSHYPCSTIKAIEKELNG